MFLPENGAKINLLALLRVPVHALQEVPKIAKMRAVGARFSNFSDSFCDIVRTYRESMLGNTMVPKFSLVDRLVFEILHAFHAQSL